MAETTTAFTACDWVIKLDDDTGALIDISGSTNTVDMNFDAKIGEFRVFSTEWMIRVACGKDASFKIKGVATTGAGEIREIVEEWFFGTINKRTFTLAAPGADVGNTLYTAEVFLKSFKFSGDATSADPVMYDIELVPSGPVVRSLIAA